MRHVNANVVLFLHQVPWARDDMKVATARKNQTRVQFLEMKNLT